MNTKISHLVTCMLLIAFSGIQLHAQEQPNLRKRATQFFNKYEYAHAVELYERLVDVKKPSFSDMEKLAECYYKLQAYDLAENWYTRVLEDKKLKQVNLWNYADVLKQNGKYKEAKQQYTRYANKFGSSARTTLAMEGADSAMRWMAKPTAHVVRNERYINTGLSEFALFPIKGGALYVGEPQVGDVKRDATTGQSFMRIFRADRTTSDGKLTNAAQLTEDFNQSEYHVGPVVCNAAEDVFYLTRTYSGEKTERNRSNGYRFHKHNLELKIYKKIAGSWVEMNFPYNNVKAYSLGHAALTADGETLYYASDMPGGYGGVDIWYSVLGADGVWGKPQNAGSMINSAGDEVFPTVHGDYLYYSSNGFVGMGGLDIFRAKGQRSSFSERENMRFPVNSASDDFAFALVKDTQRETAGYLSSNRKSGAGADDIYAFEQHSAEVKMKHEGWVYSKKDNSAVTSASVTLFDENGQMIGRTQTDPKGAFSFRLEENKTYSIVAEGMGFHMDSLFIKKTIPEQDTVLRTVLHLQPISRVGEKFVLENIFYDFNDFTIRADAAIVLNQLARTMRDNPSLVIELSSHTDSRGAELYNLKLSERRAHAAVDYLVSRGIARDRLIGKGYGESRLVNRCADGVVCSDDEHQENRRTEVEILAF